MVSRVSDDAIRAALTFIPAEDRDLWWRIGMALKSELGDVGLDMFDTWSQGAANYDPKAVKSSWKSFKAGGGVTVATLISEAKQRGFDPKKFTPPQPLSQAEKERIESERAAQQRKDAAARTCNQETAAIEAERVWAEATDSGSSPYLSRKSIDGYGVRYFGSVLLIPLRDGSGKLWNVQRIPTTGEKRFLAGGKVSGCFHIIGDMSASAWILIAEGYATAATLHEATGYPVAVAFNANNVRHVATAISKLHQKARVLICADDDQETERQTGKNPGTNAAMQASAKIGAHWCKPDALLDGETDFNDLAARAGLEVVRQQIAIAIDAIGPAQQPAAVAAGHDGGDSQSSRPFFRVDERGVWFHGFSQQGDALPPQWICSPLHVTAKSRDASNGEWGYLLEFEDGDRKPKRWAMPASMLAGDGTQYRAVLLAMGLQIGAGTQAKNQLTIYIQTRQTDVRVRCTDRIGWHDDIYVLPDATIGKGDELVMFQSPTGVVSQFKQRGTLDQWRNEVSALCRGNSRLLFCVSAAFAAPLLHHSGISSGGFHIWGDSSTGKSTAFKVAGSVYGGKDYPRNWRMTDNALETVAAQHSDALLLLDEIAQVDPKVVGDTVYMLANETGKGRATQTATARRTHTWRVLFLSDGEVSLANHMSEAGKGTRGGHDVRMAHIAADAGQGLGLYESLHGFTDGAALSNHLVALSHQYHGVAGMAFIEYAVARASRLPDALRSRVAALTNELCPAGAHGQVSRVASRFALVGIAGELATHAGITGWTEGEAIEAAKVCFSAWLDGRGGSGNTEHATIIRQVSGFFQAHGDSRFVWWHRANDDHKPNTINRAGFKRMLSKDGTPINSNTDHHKEFGDKIHQADSDGIELEYFVLPEIFRGEMCKGFSVKAVTRLLIERGLLMPEGAGDKARPDRKERLPGMGLTRCYRFNPKIVSSED